MPDQPTDINGLPHAIEDAAELRRQIGGRRLAIFSDYDGVMSPIVDRPEDAIISPRMREVVQDLSTRCSTCVVSGRDRPVVQDLMGIDNLVVAGSHGFDIWSPTAGAIERAEGDGFAGLIQQVTDRVTTEVGSIPGVLIEPKKASVAVHYRLVDEAEQPKVAASVEAVLADHPDDLKMTPGKMVFELQPKVDWDKGKAVLYLLEALQLDGDDYIPLYLGDDITDEHAFEALASRGAGRGIGVFVGRADDPEVGGRPTAASFRLDSVDQVEQFLDGLARTPETGGA